MTDVAAHPVSLLTLAAQLRTAMRPLIGYRDEFLDVEEMHGLAGVRFDAALALDQAFDKVDSALRCLEDDEALEAEGVGEDDVAVPVITKIPLPDGELRLFPPDAEEGDHGVMYVLDVLGTNLLVRERDDDVFIHVDSQDSTSPAVDGKGVALSVNNGPDQAFGL